MTSCIPPQWLTINGSIDSLSALASLSADSRFIVVKDRDKNYPQQTIKTPGDTGKSFHVSGEIKLKKDGRINWGGSNLTSLRFKDKTNRSNNFLITDYWQLESGIESIMKSNSQNFLHVALSKGFEIRGSRRKNTLDLSSTGFNDKSYPLFIFGGGGADEITGSSQSDVLAASTSRDICDFGSGTNLIEKVKDVLAGKGGKDIFYVDNGTHVADIEAGEVIHLFNHSSYDLSELANKTPVFTQKRNKTIIKIGDLTVTTNPAKFDFQYKFFTSEFKPCITDQNGTDCDIPWIPGEPEGYSFTATEIL